MGRTSRKRPDGILVVVLSALVSPASQPVSVLVGKTGKLALLDKGLEHESRGSPARLMADLITHW